jgi:predicted PurR-regulated permease PerM
VDNYRKSILEAKPESQQHRIYWPAVLRTAARWALGFAALYVVFWLLWRTGASLIPFIVGLLLAYLLQPIVDLLQRHMPRWAAILIVYLVGLGIFVLGSMFIFPPAADQVNELVTTIPERVDQVRQELTNIVDEFERRASPEVQEQINEQIQNIQETLQRNAAAYAQQVGEFLLGSILALFDTLAFLIGFLVIPFFLFYTLIDTPRLPGAINTLLHPTIRDDFWNIWSIVDSIFGKYLRGQLLLGIIVGIMTFLGLWGLNLLGYDISYTVLLSIITGFGELIPIIGPILSAVPAVIVAFGGGLPAVIAVIILYVVIQQIENQVLVPRIVGNTLKLHPALLLLLFVVAAAVGGLLLIILAPPLAAIARDVFIYVHRRLREPPQSPQMAINGLIEDQPAEEAHPVAS